MKGYTTFNFYDQSSVVIGHVINKYPAANEAHEDEEDEEVRETPEELGTDKARGLFQKLVDAGVLNVDFMPAEGLSWTKKGELASLLAIELNIKNTWKVFGTFWNIEPETLRSGFNKAREMKFKCEFDEKIMTILR